MDLLRELTEFVATQTGLVIGEELHAGNLPPLAVDRCAVIVESAGVPSLPLLRGNVGAYAFQVLCRSGRSYFDCRALADEIHRVLADCAGSDLGDWFMCDCEAVSVPQFLGFDERGRWEISTNYTVRAYQKAAWAEV